MFRMGTAPSLLSRGWIGRALVDDERGLLLQFVSGRGPVPGDALLLTVEGLQIPFDTDYDRYGPSELRFALPIVITIQSFGDSIDVRRHLGLGPIRFESVEQEQQLQLIAVEATLAYGLFFDGLTRPDGELLVSHFGTLWRLSDFGYGGASTVREDQVSE